MLIMLADAACKGFALLVATTLVTCFMRSTSAARRHLVGTLGILSLLVLPLLSAALPAWHVPWLPSRSIDSATNLPVADSTSRIASTTSQASHRDAVPRWEPPTTIAAEPVAPSIIPPTTTLAAPSRASFEWRSLVDWIVPVWAFGACLAIVVPMIGLWQLSWIVRQAQPLEHSGWHDQLAEGVAQYGIRRPVRLLTTSAISVPLTCGAWRPVLLIPMEAAEWSSERRRLVLLHELAHIQRWDWSTQMLAHVACALHWFNPLAWLAAWRMQVEREQACDDLVLASGAKASDYARELLAIAMQQSEHRLLGLAVVPMARRSAIEDRLCAVLDVRRNRAALTRRAGSLALLLLTAVLTPLAMLQASGPPAVAPQAAVPQESPTTVALQEPAVANGAEPNAKSEGLQIVVHDSKSDVAIREFRVLLGIPARGIVDAFEKRTKKTVVNWQPHTLKVGKDGRFHLPPERCYEEMAVRVEADGYAPQSVYWIKKAEGSKQLTFQLVDDPGVHGIVLQPDGQPARGATIALALPQRDAVWENGRLRHADAPLPENPSDRWRIPLFTKTDADGKFRLPTEPDVAAMFVVHDSGVRELAYDQFQKSPEVKLQPWGRVEGRVLWKDRAGSDVPLNLSVYRDDYGYPGMIASYASTKSDAEGRFVFERVLPGLVQIAQPIPTSPNNPNSNAMYFTGLLQHVQVQAGQPTSMVFGGQGRKVVGQLTGRTNWADVTFHFHPRAPHIGFSRDDEAWAAFAQFRQSAVGPLFFRDKQPVQADGKFIIENMMPGSYQLFFSVPGASQYLSYLQVQVDPETAGQAPQPLDLGSIAVTMAAESAKADADAEPNKLDTFLQRVRQSQKGLLGGNRITTNDQGQVIGLGLAEFQLQPGDAALIGQLTELTRLSLQRSNVTDADLQQLRGLTKLTTLNLWDAKIGDAGAAAISGLSTLTILHLGGTGTTDEGLKHIAKLTALRELDLARTKVTDVGLPLLSSLTKLEGLKLAETAVTDAGLATLDRLPALRGVTLDESRVTDIGLEKLATRASLNYLATDLLVAQELAKRQAAGDVQGINAMLSIGLDLPSAGTFKVRSLIVHPRTDRDRERQRQRFRIEWDWKNKGKDEGLFAVIAVRQRSARVIEAGLLEAGAAALPKPEAKTVTIRGKAVDAESGKPVAPLMVQAGKFDPTDPAKVTWGYSESRSSATDGSFSATVRWADGWTARVIADGYQAQPVLTKAPDGEGEIEVLLRLKRGRLVRGKVLDHRGEPVKGIAVFTVGPTGVNLAGGKAIQTWGGDDRMAKPILTDERGRFELAAGDATKVAVSGGLIDAWPADIAAEGDTVVRLPEPAKVEVQLDIDGADRESTFFLQLLTSHMPGFEGVRLENSLPIINPGKLSLPALPPGKYQFCRSVTNRLGMIGTGAMLEREFVELKPGETRTIRYVRDQGARVQGRLTLPAEKVMGITVQIQSEKAEKDPFDKYEWTTIYASQTAAEDGSFLTERLAPGVYELKVAAYVPLTPQQQLRSGQIRPTYGASTRIEVPLTGNLVVPELKLERIK